MHPVELDVRIKHREAGGGEVHGGELDIVPVQGLLDHGLVELGGVLASRALVSSLGLGGDRHQQGTRAAGEVATLRDAGNSWSLQSTCGGHS